MLRKELELAIDKTFFWTDSEIVLHYLKNEKRRFQTYVANRVEEIKENSLVEYWNHVPGSLNPADDVSRGLSPTSLTANHCWLHGPDFLWQPETLELNKEVHVHLVGLTTDPVEVKIEDSALKPTEGYAESPMQALITSCSDWTRLWRRVAWFLRFAQFMQDKKTARTG